MQILQIKNFSFSELFSKIFSFFSKNSFWLIVSLIIAVAIIEGFYFYWTVYFINLNSVKLSNNNITFNQEGFDSLREKIDLRKNNFAQNESLTIINPFFPNINGQERAGSLNSSSSKPSINND